MVQFSPFAALSGFEDGIKETARVTSPKIELEEDEKNLINEKLTQLMMGSANHPTVTIKYFVNDTRKSGGGIRLRQHKSKNYIYIDTRLH